MQDKVDPNIYSCKVKWPKSQVFHYRECSEFSILILYSGHVSYLILAFKQKDFLRILISCYKDKFDFLDCD